MNAFRVSVASSALWLSGCWALTKTQSSKLGVLVFAKSELALSQMLSECFVEFGNTGLEVALDNKTFFWSSSVDDIGRSLVVNDVPLPCSPALEPIGNIFDLWEHSSKSAKHCQHMANGVFRRWAPLLLNLSLPIREGMESLVLPQRSGWRVVGHSRRLSPAN